MFIVRDFDIPVNKVENWGDLDREQELTSTHINAN